MAAPAGLFKVSAIIVAALGIAASISNSAWSADSIAAVAGRILPAIVAVKAKVPLDVSADAGASNPQDAENGKENEVTGGGFLVSADGIVVAAATTVTGNDALSIILQSGDTLPAELIGCYAATGIAVHTVEAKTPLPFLQFTNRTPGPSELAIAIGSPGGFGGSIRTATVTGLSQSPAAIPFIEFKAALMNGDPGGVLADASGRVLGVIAFLQAGRGNTGELGYAVPGRIAEAAITLLKTKGQVAGADQLLATAVAATNEPPPATFEPLGAPEGASAQARAAVVSIEGRHRAAGVMLSQDGYIVTTLDAVGAQKRVRIRLDDGNALQAEVAGSDPLTDIALLKAKSPKPLPVASTSDEAALAGEQVFAWEGQGNRAVTRVGIVSATGRFDGRHFHDVLQSDIQIDDQGNGGGLFDPNGKLVGVLLMPFASAVSADKISFALPMPTVESVVAKLKQNGHIDRGWVGLQIRDGNEGVDVNGVTPGGPADQAGVRAGDLIVEVEGTPVKAAHVIARIAADAAPGTTLHVKVMRSGQPQSLNLTVGQHP
jgi:serine protease Do